MIQFIIVTISFGRCGEVLMVTVNMIPLSCDQDMTVMIRLNAALALCSNIIIVVFIFMFIFYRLAMFFDRKRVHGCKIDGTDAALRVIDSLIFGNLLHLLVFLFV